MRLVCGLLGVLMFTGVWSPAADIEIVKPGGDKYLFDLSGLSAGAVAGSEFKQTLSRDLELSGWFKAGGVTTASVLVKGAVEVSGGTLMATCMVRRRDGHSYLNRVFSGKPDKSRVLAHVVADAIVKAVTGKPGIASTRIVMVGSRGGTKDLYVCDADGGNLLQITHDKKPCLFPKWSADARGIVYTSYVGGFPDVYHIDLVSGRRRRIAAFPGLNAGADVSPDGREIVLTLSKDGNPDVYTMNLRTRRIKRVTRTQHAAEASPTWSPDGRRIVYVSDRSGSPQLYVVSRDGGRGQRISFHGSENVSPDWGPDGRIVCSSRRNGRYQLVLYTVQPQAELQITGEYVDHETPSWAPDGRHILFTKTQNYRSDLYVLDTKGDPQIRLTRLQGDWYSGAWSTR
ncbi:MAG: PD40 domain-containing protein [Kiritimatiellae bacterium]|nr:PD40 domain-containing protein [Kiritimatiellia bacterium]